MIHTPTPWEFTENADYNSYWEEYYEIKAQGVLIANMTDFYDCGKDLPAKENAKYIVKCVNMHDELVKALEACVEKLDYIVDDEDCPRTRTHEDAIELLRKAKKQ